MRFADLDARMRAIESADDPQVPMGRFVVARLDGRGFTRLTKQTLDLNRPFDERFWDWMLATATHLTEDSGFSVRFTFTQSDEISLLLDPEDNTFGRKTRKMLSVLAGEASARFTEAAGHRGTFDCRLSVLPNEERVVDYFRWRSADATRNALNAVCYWTLRAEGQTRHQATAALSGITVADKNELLCARGINFNALPLWQRRGCALYREWFDKDAHNPLTGEAVVVRRRKLVVNDALPMKDAFTAFLKARLFSDGCAQTAEGR
ncbi:MAG: tRNA(His) guanylyltransferase Thg1 family protein [Myxococcota bacterium]